MVEVEERMHDERHVRWGFMESPHSARVIHTRARVVMRDKLIGYAEACLAVLR